MNSVGVNLIRRHGEDDFSLWSIRLDEKDYKAAMEIVIRHTGKPNSILEQLPMTEEQPDTFLHFFTANEKSATVITTQVSENL